MRLTRATIEVAIPRPTDEVSMTDEIRAERAAQSLRAWRLIDAMICDDTVPSGDTSPVGPLEIVQMLGDLRFLCDRLGLDLGQLDREAYKDYLLCRQSVKFLDARVPKSLAG